MLGFQRLDKRLDMASLTLTKYHAYSYSTRRSRTGVEVEVEGGRSIAEMVNPNPKQRKIASQVERELNPQGTASYLLERFICISCASL